MPKDVEQASKPAVWEGIDFLCAVFSIFSPCVCVSSLLHTKSRCVTMSNPINWAAFNGGENTAKEMNCPLCSLSSLNV